ncbi:MAG: 6-phosphogluconate dehydrogenase [Flavobacterium sp.]|jgi:6-phosphogluconate dehydrogenase
MEHNGIEYAEMQLLAEVYKIIVSTGEGNLEEISNLLFN